MYTCKHDQYTRMQVQPPTSPQLMRDAITAATGRPPPPVVPAPVVYDYGQTHALQWLPLLDVLDVLVPEPVESFMPPTLEDAGQGYAPAL